MRVALIYPQFYPEEHWSTIAAQERNLGIFPPLSLAYVASILRKHGHQVIIIDVAALKLSLPGVIKQVKEFQPHLLGFTITTSLFHQNLSWIRQVKRDIDVPVIVGGVHVGIYPQETMAHGEIDFAMIGDAELNLPEFMKALEGQKDFEKINGLCFRRNSKVVVNKAFAQAMDLDDFPFPARQLLPNERYYSIVSQRKNFTAMITSRGCVFNCIFCDQGPKKPLLRSASNVVDEIEECYHTFGIREIDFFDPSFTIDKPRVIEICRQIRKRNIDVIWSLRTRIDTVNEELLDEMSSAGCIRIMYGIESAVPSILASLRKHTDINQIKNIIHLTNKKKIEVFGFFVIGSPGETARTVRETMRFAKKSELHHAQFTRLTAFPGTELYKRYVDKYKFDYWRHYVLDEHVKKVLPLVDTELSIREANAFVRSAYLSFYLHPVRMIKIICKIRSFRQFRKSIVALSDMLRDKTKEV
jgi:anaerobic magnesium-protoporphyrin IX monomethyl ester cyclase